MTALSIFALPAFWRGAASARAELMRRRDGGPQGDALRHHQAIDAYESIAEALGKGKSLAEIPEFAAYMASAHRRLARAPDPLEMPTARSAA